MYRCVSPGPELCYSLKWMLGVAAGTIPASPVKAPGVLYNMFFTACSLQRVCVCVCVYVCVMHLALRIMAFLVAQKAKNLPAIWETWARSLGWEDPLEKGMAIHVGILAWRSP